MGFNGKNIDARYYEIELKGEKYDDCLMISIDTKQVPSATLYYIDYYGKICYIKDRLEDFRIYKKYLD